MSGPITRKEFLTSTAKTAVAAASVGAIGMGLVSSASGQTRQLPIGPNGTNAAATWPWPYVKLDAEDIRKRAHKYYYDGGCCYGAFQGLLSALAERIGEPFTSMPAQAMYFGGGGGAGWGTLCGALNGAAVLISLVTDRANANTLVSELFGWYTTATFPSDVSNHYAVTAQFYTNRNATALVQTQPGSALCHASVSSWCTDAHVKAGAPERAERCARLTGDVAARTVEMLNSYFDGQFRATFVPPRSVTDCQSCHGSVIANVQSGVKMACPQCHNDSWRHTY